MDRDELKRRACATIDARSADLIALSMRIHANPETAFNEHRASEWLTELLAREGFEVARGICELPTAFRAVAGSGRPSVAIVAEYDALPEIGHGCGHNIIAASSAGAGIGVLSVLGDIGAGSVHVIGTPAEEVYGGKAIMVRHGAFDGLDAAMMTHPGGRDAVFAKALACAEVTVEYHGREAHAAAQPERGINALEAMIIAFNSINSLRQHIRRTARVHGVITDGGAAPNIVPGHSAASFLVRAEDDEYLEELKLKVAACFEAGATATGATLELRWNENQYAAMNTNRVLAEAHRRNLAALGREVRADETPRPLGSTDMGNVSKVVPSIHPAIAIAPLEVNGHSRQFAEYAASDSGQKAVIDGAKALAMTAIDILADDDLRRAMREEFERDVLSKSAP
ncbi:MAG TPA: M20 family metallopeptidase [Dehalococcoidia bacterium]|nr:M20 family metallopeptidase [Dehalococcoidia bacterium]